MTIFPKKVEMFDSLLSFRFCFHMEDCKPALSPFQFGVKLVATCISPKVDATLYRQLVGSLLYLTHTRPDLSFVVGLVAQYMQPLPKCISP
jgi:hypothetical protein